MFNDSFEEPTRTKIQFGNVRQVSSHVFGSGSPPSPVFRLLPTVNLAAFCAHYISLFCAIQINRVYKTITTVTC